MWVGTGSGLSRFPRKGIPVRQLSARGRESAKPGPQPSLERAGRPQRLPVDLRRGQAEPAGSRERPAHGLPARSQGSAQHLPQLDFLHAARTVQALSGLAPTAEDSIALTARTERFFAYRNQANRPGSLSSDLVLSLFEDRQGVLWVGTQAGGLNRLDPISGRFTSWRNNPADPHSLSHNNVIAIHEDRAGFLWIGTLDGLNRFDPRTGQFLVYRNNAGGSSQPQPQQGECRP